MVFHNHVRYKFYITIVSHKFKIFKNDINCSRDTKQGQAKVQIGCDETGKAVIIDFIFASAHKAVLFYILLIYIDRQLSKAFLTEFFACLYGMRSVISATNAERW
jgi:ABC-type uncharacterized transport system ATPase subunit